MSDQPKLCKDCAHCSPAAFDPENSNCIRPGSGKISPVTGAVKLPYCDVERRHEDLCGPAGRYWEPRAPVTLRELIKTPAPVGKWHG